MNNEDLFGTVNVRAMSKLSLRSEGHTLRLASEADLWYSGGGAFEPKTFGYTGPSKAIGGWRTFGVLSADYQIKHSFSTICTIARRG